MFWPTINSYKRLVDGFWAPVKPTWGMDNRTASFRVIAGSPKATRLETRCPGADVNPYLAMAAVIAAGLRGHREGLEADRAADHRHQPGRGAHPARAAHPDRDDAHLPAVAGGARLVRRRLRRPLRRDPRLGMAAVARRRDRLGIEAVLRDHLNGSCRASEQACASDVRWRRSPAARPHRRPSGRGTRRRAVTVRIATAFDPQTMDPHALALLYHSRVVFQVYDSLVNRDEQFRLEPALALSWQAGRRQDLALQAAPGRRRSTTARRSRVDDAVFSIERAMTPPSQRALPAQGRDRRRRRSTSRRSRSSSRRPTRCCPRSSSSCR